MPTLAPIGLVTQLRAITPAEAPDRIALHLSRVVERALASSSDRDTVEIGKEVLAQSLATFRHAVRDAAFGELWVDGKRLP